MKLRWFLGLAILCAQAGAATLRLDARTVFDRAVSTDVNSFFGRLGPGIEFRRSLRGRRAGFRLLIQAEPGKAVFLGLDPQAIAYSRPASKRGGADGRWPRQFQRRRQCPPADRGATTCYGSGPLAGVYHQSGGAQAGGERYRDVGSRGGGHRPVGRFPQQLPKRSARSADGGASWSNDRLGPEGNISGEYYVRVFLEHHRAKGSILLPVWT